MTRRAAEMHEMIMNDEYKGDRGDFRVILYVD